MFRSLLPVAFIALLLSVPASAEEPAELQLSLKNHLFEPSELKAPANRPFLIVLTNEDDAPEEFESSSLKFEKLVTPKGSIKLRIRALAPGRYDFFGEYHETAKGVLIVE